MILKKNLVLRPYLKNKIFLIEHILLSVLLLSITTFLFLHFLAFDDKRDIINISNNWELYTVSKGTTVNISNIKELGNNNPDETLYLSKVLKEIDSFDTLLIKNLHQNIRVYLDEVKLFETPTTLSKDPGIGISFVRLPPNYGQKTLRFEISSPYSYYVETACPVYIGTASSLFVFILSEAFPNLFYLFTCLITGFFLIIYSTYLCINGINKIDKLCLGLFSVLWGFYCISWDNIACLFFSPLAISRISTLLHIIYLIPFFIYFRFNFTIFRKFTFALQLFFCSIVGITCILLFLSIIDYPNTVLVFNYILDAVFLPMIIIGWLEFRQGNPLIRFLSPTILLIIIGAIGTVLEQYTLIKGIFFYLASIFIFICFNWIYSIKEILNWRTEEKEELKTLELKNSLILNRYNEIQSHVEKIHKIKHEAKHHIIAIQILCKERNIDKIEEYLSTISSNTVFTEDISYSNHPIVDCILSNYVIQTRELNIQFDYIIDIPKVLPLPDTDLCILLLNILDNALEASTLSYNKWIKLEISLKRDFLFILCQNSHQGTILEKDGDFITQKNDKDSHGYGIPIIKSILEKYGDILTISYDSKQFTLKAVLQF